MRNHQPTKTTYVVSCDPDIKAAFMLKFRGTGSSIIESFMRDMCNIDSDVSTAGADEEAQLQEMAESIAAEKHKLAIQLRGIDLRRKELLDKKKQEVSQQELNDKIREREFKEREKAINDEEFAMNEIRLRKETISFKLACERAQKLGYKLTAKQFYENNFALPSVEQLGASQ